MKNKSKKIIALLTTCLIVLSSIVVYAGPKSPVQESKDKSKDTSANDTIKYYDENNTPPASTSTSTTGVTNTSVRGKNANNSNAGFTASDGEANNALVYRMGLARLTNEEVIYTNDIESKALAVQEYGAKYYVATQGSSYVYGPGSNLATSDYRGNACIPAPDDSLSYKVLNGIETNTEVPELLLKRDDGSMYIDPTTENIDELMSELASLDGINQGLYEQWKQELSSPNASKHPVVIVIEVCGVVVGDGSPYFAACSDMCLRIGGQSALDTFLTTDLNTYPNSVTSLTDSAIANLTGYGIGTTDYDTWPYRWTKRFFATTWKPGSSSANIVYLPGSGTRSRWAQTAWQTLSAGGSTNGINGCTIVTIGGAGVTGTPEGYFDWHIDAQDAVPNSTGHAEDQIVYSDSASNPFTRANKVGSLCIAQENYALWESWFNILGATEATLEVTTYHLGQANFTTNAEAIKAQGGSRTGQGIVDTDSSGLTQQIVLQKDEFFTALEDESYTLDLANDILGPNLDDNGMLSVAYAMDVNVVANGVRIPLTNEACHWIIYSTNEKKTYTFQQIIEGPYAQIKQGGLDKEKYEAMAGTPTTEDLFVSMGGNQYVVNMQFRYCEDDYVRTYHCYTPDTPNYTYYKMSSTSVTASASDGMSTTGSTVDARNTSSATVHAAYETRKTALLGEARVNIANRLLGLTIDTNDATYDYTTCLNSGAAIKNAFNSWIASASADGAESPEVTLFAGQDPETGKKFCIKAKLTLSVTDEHTDDSVASTTDADGNVTGATGGCEWEVSYSYTMQLVYGEDTSLSQSCLTADKNIKAETTIEQTFENVKYMDIIEAQVWQLAEGREVGVGAILCEPVSNSDDVIKSTVKQLGYVFYDSDSNCSHEYEGEKIWRCINADDLESTGRLVNSYNESTMGAAGTYINNDEHAFKVIEWGDTVELEYDPSVQGGRSHQSINVYFAQAAAHSFYDGASDKPYSNTILCVSDVLSLETEGEWLTYSAFEFDTKHYKNEAESLYQYILQPDYTDVTQYITTSYSKDAKNANTAHAYSSPLFTSAAAYNNGIVPLNDSVAYGEYNNRTICEEHYNSTTFVNSIKEENNMPFAGYHGDYQTSSGSHATTNATHGQSFEPYSSSIWSGAMDAMRPGVTEFAEENINESGSSAGDKYFPYKEGLNVNRTQANEQYKTGYASLLYEHIVEKDFDAGKYPGVGTIQIYSDNYSTVKKISLKDTTKYPKGMFLNAVYTNGYTSVNDVIIFNPTTAEKSGVVELTEYLPDALNTEGSDNPLNPTRDQRVGTSTTTTPVYTVTDYELLVPSNLATTYYSLEDYDNVDVDSIDTEISGNQEYTATTDSAHTLTLYDGSLHATTVTTPLTTGDVIYRSNNSVYKKGREWTLTSDDLINGRDYDGSKLTYDYVNYPGAPFEAEEGDSLTVNLDTSLSKGEVLHLYFEIMAYTGELADILRIDIPNTSYNECVIVNEEDSSVDYYVEITDNTSASSLNVIFDEYVCFPDEGSFTFLEFTDVFLFSIGDSYSANAHACGTIAHEYEVDNTYSSLRTYNPYCTDYVEDSVAGDLRNTPNTLYISYRDSWELATLRAGILNNPHKVYNSNWRYHVIGWKTTGGNTIYTPNDSLLYEDTVSLVFPGTGESITIAELKQTACLVQYQGRTYVTTTDGISNGNRYIAQTGVTCTRFDNFTLSSSPDAVYSGSYPLQAGQSNLMDEYEFIFALTDTDGILFDVRNATNLEYRFAKDDKSHDVDGVTENWVYDWKKVEKVRSASEPVVSADGTTISGGTFISLDDAFSVYYENYGDFYQSSANHIAQPSSTALGLGYTNGMKTTKWLKEKYVVFEMDVWMFDEYDPTVSYEDRTGLYFIAAGTEIPLGYYDGDSGESDNEGHFIDYAGRDGESETDKSGGTYYFWCALSSQEAAGSPVTFRAVNINAPSEGNSTPNNKDVPAPPFRYADAKNTVPVDIVGRIGALTMVDTGDYRFSNTFKSTNTSSGWLVYNLVRALEPYTNVSGTPSTQRKLVADPFDVRGRIGLSTMLGLVESGYNIYNTSDSLNTYNTQWHKDLDTLKQNKSTLDYLTDAIVSLPLTSAYNDISALQLTEQKVGYKNYMTLESIGTYHGGDSILFDKLDENSDGSAEEGVTPVNLNGDYNNNKIQIRPYYLAVEINDAGDYVASYPVDVYMKAGNTYKIINTASSTASEAAKVMNENPYYYYMSNNISADGSLDQNMLRRMVTTEETNITNRIIDLWNYFDNTTVYKSLLTNFSTDGDLSSDISPTYTYGTGQYLFLRARNRTFVGASSQALNGEDIATGLPGSDYNLSQDAYAYAELNYNSHAQKWYFDLGLPSSAVFVRSGVPFSPDAIVKDKNVYIIQAADIYALGDVWTLHYESPVAKYAINISGTSITYEKWNSIRDKSEWLIPVTIYNSGDTDASADLDTGGSH